MSLRLWNWVRVFPSLALLATTSLLAGGCNEDARADAPLDAGLDASDASEDAAPDVPADPGPTACRDDRFASQADAPALVREALGDDLPADAQTLAGVVTDVVACPRTPDRWDVVVPQGYSAEVVVADPLEQLTVRVDGNPDVAVERTSTAVVLEQAASPDGAAWTLVVGAPVRTAYAIEVTLRAADPCTQDPSEPDAPDVWRPLTDEANEGAQAATFCDGQDRDAWSLAVPAGATLGLRLVQSAPVAAASFAVTGVSVEGVDLPIQAEERGEGVLALSIEAQPTPWEARIEATALAGTGRPYTLRWSLETPPPPQDVAVRGVLTTDDRAYDAVGLSDEATPIVVPGARVQLEDVDGVVLAQAVTDETGRFTLLAQVPETTQLQVVAIAEGTRAHHSFRVVDRARRPALYRHLDGPRDAASLLADQAATWDVHVATDDEAGPAFHILTVLDEGFDRLLAWTPPPSPLLTVQWERGLPFGCGSCYGRDVISLGAGVEDTDEYDDDIILHEFAHHFVRYWSRDTSPGGPHRDRLVAPTLAWGEGLAYFLVHAMRGSPLVIDTFADGTRVVNLDTWSVNEVGPDEVLGTSDGTLLGNHREELVAGVLWRMLALSGEVGADGPGWSFETMLDVLTTVFPQVSVDVGAPGADLADWLHVAACGGPTPIVETLTTLAVEAEYPWEPTTPSCLKGGPTPTLAGDALALALRAARLHQTPCPNASP